MNKVNFVTVIFFLMFVSCSTPDNSCPCVRTNGGSFLPDNEVDEGYCTGEIETTSSVLYQRICDE